MKNYILLLFFALIIFGCKNLLINQALGHVGIYEDRVELKRLNYSDKKIVFIPMHHIGTNNFFNDVKHKIDSLKNKGYFFFYEKVKINNEDTISLKKFRKIFRNPLLQKNSSYKKHIDSLYPNLKFKKPLIDQPSYKILGLTDENSMRVDVDSKDMIGFYENKYGKIKLTDCDIQTSVYKKFTKCKEENIVSKEQSNDVLVNFRNDFVMKEIKESQYPKIAIIYGEEHMDGIVEKISSIKN